MTSSKSAGIELKVKGYLKQHPDATLKEIGEFVGVSRQRVHVLLQRMELKTQTAPRKTALTPHQLDILSYVAKGYTDIRIAKVMGCSAQSIRNQLQTIYKKLEAHERRHAVQQAINQGIMPPDYLKRQES